MNINNPKIKDLLDNEEKYIKELMTMSDKVLDRKLYIVRQQMQIALEQKLFNEVDVLYLFQNMIIKARVKKNEIERATGIYEEEIKSVKKKKAETLQQNKNHETIENNNKENELTTDDVQEQTTKIEQITLFD